MTNRKTPPAFLDLYDDYCHGRSIGGFFRRAAAFTVAGASSLAIVHHRVLKAGAHLT